MASRKHQPLSAKLERPAVDRGFPVWFVDVLIEQLGVDENSLTPQARLCEDLGADSLDVVELAMTFEDQHNLPDFSDAVLDRWATATLMQILGELQRLIDGAKR